MTPSTKDKLFIATQGLIFILYVLPIHWPLPNMLSVRGFGLGLAWFSVVLFVLAIWQLNKSKLRAYPSPADNARLITTGVLARLHHPIYVAIVVGLLGYGLYKGNGYKLAVTAVLYGFFIFKSRYEERLLLAHFGPDYAAYMKKAKGLI